VELTHAVPHRPLPGGVAGSRHGVAEIMQYLAGASKPVGRLLKAGDDVIGMFRSDLPCVQTHAPFGFQEAEVHGRARFDRGIHQPSGSSTLPELLTQARRGILAMPMAEVIQELHQQVMEAAERDGQRAEFPRHVLEFSSLKEGLETDVRDQVVAVFSPLGDQIGQKGRMPQLTVGSRTDHLDRAEGGQLPGDYLARGRLLHVRPLFGGLIETVAEPVGDSHGIPGAPPMVATLAQQFGRFQGVVFFRP
jgi:hypothetical protein